uniref:G-protein coupled receptors family 3 profile domain-containing protein n=1 Tax=Timema genevievae TaxID=629358 RepID=A0A7R9PIJ8_TIMGE|nr:unnamed protein product [Timema genevievae]
MSQISTHACPGGEGSYSDEGGRLFKFLDGRDGPLRYSILNFQKDLNGSYKWNVVGNYTQSENGLPMLKIDQKAITYRRNESGNFPKSTCTQSCEVHQIKVRESGAELCGGELVGHWSTLGTRTNARLGCASKPSHVSLLYVSSPMASLVLTDSSQLTTDDTCCWQCRSCGEFQRKSNDHKCSECPSGTRPNPDHSVCVDIPEEFIDFHDPWAIGAMAVASLGGSNTILTLFLFTGVLLTVFVALIFWTYSDTPVIKASGRELSYLLLLGTLASFCMTFVIVSRPTSFTCGLTRFFLGFCYTLCYAAIVTKTNRIARIFNNTAHSPHKTRYTSPQSQLVITALLTLVEVVINVTWLMYVPPRVIHVYPDRGSRVLICDGLKDHSYFVGLLYPFILIGMCTAYAIKTRKCPGGFNETRHIAFTNYTTIIIWLAFVPLYLASTSNSIRIVTLAISLSLGGLVQLGCLFFPKLYIVLFKPEKNTKEVVMSQHRSTVYLSTPSNLTPVVVVNGGTHYVQSAGVMNVDATEVAKKGRSNTGSGIWRNKPSLKEVMTTTKTSPDLVQGGHTKDDAFAEEAPKSQIRTM